mgnify:CR=1 FL=1
MKVCVISSGSKGNMTYVSAGSTNILIDAGISLLNAIKRVPDIDFSCITDILVTHEHGDHIGFLDTVLKKTNANLFISKKSFIALKPEIKDRLIGRRIAFIEGDSCYKIGDVEVCTLNLLHDTANNFGYIIMHNGKKFGYFTDTGIFPSRYKYLLKELDCFVIEANHNVEMLINSDRDPRLINRILSTSGHLSNQVCFEVLNETLTNKVKYVILGHISEDCNSLHCLNEEIINKLNNYQGEIIVSSQNEATKIIEF